MRIAFIISGLGAGGSERIATTLCNGWQKLGHQVEIVTFEVPDQAPHYKLNDNIIVHRLDLFKESHGLSGSVLASLKRLRSLRHVLCVCQPNVVVSFGTETNVLTILANLGLRWPVVVSERIHPGHHLVSSLTRILRKLCYPRAARVVVQTEAIAEWTADHLGCPALVIPNPVKTPLETTSRKAENQPNSIVRGRIIAVGRLTHQKGYDLLIAAFAEIAASYPGWTLDIFGNGEDHDALSRQIEQAELSRRATLRGISKDLAHEYATADLFVHPARYEGFPNSLAEAAAAGLAIIATDCPGATADILENGTAGMLVPTQNRGALAEAMAYMIESYDMRRKFGERARQSVGRYAETQIVEDWLEFLGTLTTGVHPVGHGPKNSVAHKSDERFPLRP